MSGLALVPAWFWIALGTILALAGLVAGVRWWWWVKEWLALFDPRRWRYSRQQARHVVALTEAEGRDFYGSMTLPPAGPHSCCCHGGFSGEHDCCLHPRPRVPLSPAGYLRGLDRVLASTTTTSPPPADPEDYDPELDEPFRWLPAPEVAHGEPTEAEVAASRAAHGYIPELDAALNDQPDPYLDALTAQYGSEFEGPLRQLREERERPWQGGFDGAGDGQHERLADTGDIAAAHLAADALAFMRAQDADVAADITGRAEWCARVREELAVLV